MPSRYAVRTVVFQSGERFPILVDCLTGIPHFDATLFAVTTLRAKNRASATLLQATRSLMVAHQALDHLGIDLHGRMREGMLLQPGEIEALARLSRLEQAELNRLSDASEAPIRNSRPVRKLELVRMRSRESEQKEVDSATAGIRLRYIRDYLTWLSTGYVLRMPGGNVNRASLRTATDALRDALTERLPSNRDAGNPAKRQGMAPTDLARVLSVIEPTSPDNPWKGAHVRERNFLIFRWLLSLGLRKGELLGIRIGDINFQSNEVLVARRADDIEDPRKYEPNTKTRARLLELDADLARLTKEYVLGPRLRHNSARKHPFLFVANGTGAPLTLVAVNKLFVELRTKCAGLPNELTPHVLRHTWNDRFSELMDERQVNPELEERLRAQQMGWVDGSKTGRIYTRRHIARKAREASLALQQNLVSKRKGK